MTLTERIELRAKVVDALADAAPLPMSTLDLGDRFGLNGYTRRYLWLILDRLARQKHVERIRLEGHTCRYWRWAARACPDYLEELIPDA
jgi:hypothetical protein